MSTLKQIEANRRNARKSTGPRSAAGKAASSANALQHGLYANSPALTGEDSEAYREFARSYEERFQPVTPEEHTLLASLVRNAWSLERYTRVERELWDGCLRILAKDEPHQPFPMAESYIALQATLQKLQQRIDAAERSYRRALDLLTKLKAQRPQEVIEENGFVSPNPPEAPARPPAPAPHSADFASAKSPVTPTSKIFSPTKSAA